MARNKTVLFSLSATQKSKLILTKPFFGQLFWRLSLGELQISTTAIHVKASPVTNRLFILSASGDLLQEEKTTSVTATTKAMLQKKQMPFVAKYFCVSTPKI